MLPNPGPMDAHPANAPGDPEFVPTLEAMLRRELDIALRLFVDRSAARLSEAEIAGTHSGLYPLCAAARARGLRAEQLIVMTRQIFAGLPHAGVIAAKPDGAELLGRIVSQVIDAYYDAPVRAD